MDFELLSHLPFTKQVVGVYKLFTGLLYRVIFTDQTETFIVYNKNRGLIEPLGHRRKRLQLVKR